MIVRRVLRTYEKNRNEVLGLALRRYPSFVWSKDAPRSIPVFQFHDVTALMLEPLLEYLYRNGYATLTADEYFERVTGAITGGNREVLLKFDDGEFSLYEVAYPMLRRFGQRAVAYIVPGRVPEPDVASNKEQADLLCNWKQLREMHECGGIKPPPKFRLSGGGV